MKILIGYDGSPCSDAALDDLKTAGLPPESEAVVLSVSEVWLSPEQVKKNAGSEKYAPAGKTAEKPFPHGKNNISETAAFVRHARSRLLENFPGWRVCAETAYGSPAAEIVGKARELKADLIVIGSHGRSALGRFFLGSISQKVLTEAECSVRVARKFVEASSAATRVLIGYDGSAGANAAIEAVAARNWDAQSEFLLVSVADPITPSTIGRFVPPIANWVEQANQSEKEWIETIAAEAVQKLRDANLSASHRIRAGNPKNVLVEEAESWGAQTIFVGANRFGSQLERFLLGSVSAAVAARAHCSVEVIRP